MTENDCEKVFHRTAQLNLLLWLVLMGSAAAGNLDVWTGWPAGRVEVEFLVIVVGTLFAAITQHRAWYRYRDWKRRQRRQNAADDMVAA
jgi:hypothetical protein